MNHVRKILQDVDGIELVFRNGYFCMVFGEEFYCDYIRLMNLTSPDKKERDSRCHTCRVVGDTFTRKVYTYCRIRILRLL